MKNEFYIVRKEILPDNVENILKARELIANDGYSITDACEKAGQPYTKTKTTSTRWTTEKARR